MSVQLHQEPVHIEPEFVQFEVEDQVATIWLNRPEVRNCVNWALLEQFGRPWSGPSRTRMSGWCWSAGAARPSAPALT